MAYLDSKPYSTQQIANIRKMLVAHHEAGQDLHFEFKADDLVFIPRTNKMTAFDIYRDFITPNTQEIEFSIYSSNPADRNKTTHSFYLKEPQKEKSTDDSVNGVNPENKLNEALAGLKKEMQYERLEEKFKQKEQDFDELEEFATQVQEENQTLKAQLFKQGDSKFAHFAGIALEGIAKRNTHIISKVPGLEGIAEVLANDEKPKKEIEKLPEREVSFNTPEEETEPLTETEKSYLEFGEFMDAQFNDTEIHTVFGIVKKLAVNKSHIKTVSELLENK
jgi:hypothetical protein